MVLLISEDLMGEEGDIWRAREIFPVNRHKE